MKAHVRELGRRIAEKRREGGFTQDQLAEAAGINVKSLRGVEQGKTEPELRTMRKIAKALATPLDVLMPVEKANPGSPVDNLVLEIERDIRLLPAEPLLHVAAIVRLLVGDRTRERHRA